MRARALGVPLIPCPVWELQHAHPTPNCPAVPTTQCSTARALGSRCKVDYLAPMGRECATMWLLLGLNGRSERYSQYALLSAITPLKHGLLMSVTRVRLKTVSRDFIFHYFAIM